MAASDSQLAAGRSLAGDLRAIRRKHAVDLKEVLDATRLADDVIEQLEEDALVNHPAFNRVYLRSLFGAYGEAIGVKREDIIAAIEEVFEGNYVGALARTYLGNVVDDSDVDAILTARIPDPDEAALAARAGQSGADEVDMVLDEMEPSEENDSLQNPATSPDSVEDTVEVVEEVDTDEESALRIHEAEPEESSVLADSEPEESEAANGEDKLDPKVIRPKDRNPSGESNVWTGLADRKTVLLPNMSGTALVVIAGIAFVALLWFAISTIVNLGQDDEPAVVLQDTTAVQEVFRPERVLLPDTIDVSIIAFTEPLDPIRITADRDLRKPYWVELLDTHRVAFTERLQLEREADHTKVLVDGFAVPMRWLTEDDPVDISRNRVQAWLDSLVSEGIAPQREPPPPPSPSTSPLSSEGPQSQ